MIERSLTVSRIAMVTLVIANAIILIDIVLFVFSLLSEESVAHLWSLFGGRMTMSFLLIAFHAWTLFLLKRRRILACVIGVVQASLSLLIIFTIGGIGLVPHTFFIGGNLLPSLALWVKIFALLVLCFSLPTLLVATLKERKLSRV